METTLLSFALRTSLLEYFALITQKPNFFLMDVNPLNQLSLSQSCIRLQFIFDCTELYVFVAFLRQIVTMYHKLDLI
jgi:hypothetical protein